MEVGDSDVGTPAGQSVWTDTGRPLVVQHFLHQLCVIRPRLTDLNDTSTDLTTLLPGNMTTTSQGAPYALSAYSLWAYISPVLILLGTVGNGLSAAVMLRPGLRQSVSALYLIVLALVDTLILCVGLLRCWLWQIFDLDIRAVSTASCKLHVFWIHFLVHLEAWILVSLSVERFLAVFFPLASKLYVNRRTAVTELGILTAALAAVNMHFFWTYDLQAYNDEMKSCMPGRGYARFISAIWSWVDCILASFLPWAIMLGTNCSLAVKLLQTDDNRMVSLSIALPAVCLLFAITTAPSRLKLVFWDHRLMATVTMEDCARQMLINALLFLLMYTNNAVNFFLYCVGAPRFRQELKLLLCKT